MINERLQEWGRTQAQRLARLLLWTRLTPNALTVIGLLLNCAVAGVLAGGYLRWGGLLVIIAGLFDLLDGAMARVTGQITRFGSFLDSTLDRYSEAVVFGGLLVYLLSTDDGEIGAVLVFVATVGALLISYARARAEAAGYAASVGLVARPERVILLAICLLIARPLWALWVLAITTHLTALIRILHVRRLAAAESPGGASRQSAGAPSTASPGAERR